jgi:hypothetical protein
LPVLSLPVLIPWQKGANVLDLDLCWADRHSHVPCTTQNCAADVAILSRGAWVGKSGEAGLGNLLVDNAIQILPGEEMVVTVEDDRRMVADQ